MFDPGYRDNELIVSGAKVDGWSLAKEQYPYLVERDTAAVVALARHTVRSKFEALGHSSLPERVESDYVNKFVKEYLDMLAELDKEEQKGKESAVQPATSANVATLQGATVRLTNVDRSKPNEYVYSLELTDPAHFEGVEKHEWVVYF